VTVVGRPTAADKVTVDDETGERDETDRTHDVTAPGAATPDAGTDGVPADDPSADEASAARSDDPPTSAPLPPSSQVLHPLPVQPRRSPAKMQFFSNGDEIEQSSKVHDIVAAAHG